MKPHEHACSHDRRMSLAKNVFKYCKLQCTLLQKEKRGICLELNYDFYNAAPKIDTDER